MLPYDENDENGEYSAYPFNEGNYNDFNTNVEFESYEQAAAVYDALSDYLHDQGFSNEQWMENLTSFEITYSYDDDGTLHYDIEYEWYSDDNGYGGKGHASSS
jgi:hypothetical protein